MEKALTLHDLNLSILVILILVFIFILGLLIYSFREYKLEANRQQWKNKLDSFLMEAIVENNTNIPLQEDLVELSRYAGFRRFFLNQLISSERKFSGVASNVLQAVFHQYNLDKEAIRLLNSSKAHLIARGIQALTIMKVERAYPTILKFQQHKNEQVLHEVQYAMVQFDGFNGLAFLNQLQLKLSDWQQLRILNSIKSYPQNSSEKLNEWLDSSNSSVVIFVLKMIRKFQIFEMHPKLIEMLSLQTDRIQTEIIKTLFVIETDLTFDLLVSEFPKFSLKSQKEVIVGFSHNRAFDQLDFLKDQLLNHPNKQIKIFAAEALNNLGEVNYLIYLSETLQQQDPTVLVLNHALQRKI